MELKYQINLDVVQVQVQNSIQKNLGTFHIALLSFYSKEYIFYLNNKLKLIN